KLNEWSSQAPPGKPLLVWCLEEGHVSAGEYLMWASERYGLPVLSSAFFESGGLNPPFVHSHRNTGGWSAWCFPVDEWEGLTYVACVEPPEERAKEVCYVLADPRAMSEAWEVTNSGISMPEEHATDDADAPVGISFGGGGGTKVFKLN